MTQHDIYAFLKKNKGKYYTANEIALVLNCTSTTIRILIRKLTHKKYFKSRFDVRSRIQETHRNINEITYIGKCL